MDPLTLCMSAVADGSGSFISAVIDTITTTVDPHVSTITMPGVLEYAAVVSGALSGAMIACERKLDILGVVVLAIVTGLGGGLLRDMILPTDSVYMIDNPMTMVVAALAATLVFFFRSAIGRFKALIFIFDILSVALFTFSGADKALRLDMDYGFLSCVLMGVITAVGGGMLRDICLGEVPSIFRAGNFYAIASLARRRGVHGPGRRARDKAHRRRAVRRRHHGAAHRVRALQPAHDRPGRPNAQGDQAAQKGMEGHPARLAGRRRGPRDPHRRERRQRHHAPHKARRPPPAARHAERRTRA